MFKEERNWHSQSCTVKTQGWRPLSKLWNSHWKSWDKNSGFVKSQSRECHSQPSLSGWEKVPEMGTGTMCFPQVLRDAAINKHHAADFNHGIRLRTSISCIRFYYGDMSKMLHRILVKVNFINIHRQRVCLGLRIIWHTSVIKMYPPENAFCRSSRNAFLWNWINDL